MQTDIFKKRSADRFEIGAKLEFNGTRKVTIEVRRAGKAFGSLEILNGSVAWIPRYKHDGSRVGWQAFHKLMSDV